MVARFVAHMDNAVGGTVTPKFGGCAPYDFLLAKIKVVADRANFTRKL